MNSVRSFTLIRSFFDLRRYYRGKYFTHYQIKLARSKPKSHLAYSVTPSNILVNYHLNSNEKQDQCISNDKLEEPTSVDELHQVSNLYKMADDDFRKMLFYGSENAEISQTDFTCHGCGSNLNCKSVDNPGYIPFEVYTENKNDENAMKNMLCLRCFFLKNELDPVDISLDDEFYRDTLTKLIERYPDGASVILLVDMSDLPFSIPPNLDDLLPLDDKIRITLVGNKYDLISSNNRCVDRAIDILKEAARSRGVPMERVQFTDVVSALDCNRLDRLIDQIISPKFYRNEPIFMIGSANVGKSSMFNKFLKSDLCKTIAKVHIRQALITNIPGTTLHTLRFPMVNLSPALLDRRKLAKLYLSDGRMESSVSTKYPLINSDELTKKKTSRQEIHELVSYSYGNHQVHNILFDEHSMRSKYDSNYKFDESKITTNKWFYDTPGYINPDQIINYLPQDQLKSFCKTDLSKPRIYIVKSGLSLIMENLTRIDVIDVPQHVYFCVHAHLPVEIVHTYDLERYCNENDHQVKYSFKDNLPKQLLHKVREKVPDFQPQANVLPALVPMEMQIETSGFKECSADIVLSSVGWVSVSGMESAVCRFVAWTPAGIGCALRVPSLINTSINRRVGRIPSTREFNVN